MEDVSNRQGLDSKKMRTQAQTCLHIVYESQAAVFGDAMPADKFLGREFRSKRHLGSRDRAFITGTLFAFYRWFGWIRKAFGDRIYSPDELPRMLLASLAADGYNPPAAEIWCADSGIDCEFWRQLFEMPSPAKRFESFIEKFEKNETAVSDADLFPHWIISELSPCSRAELFQMLQIRPPVWIRTQKCDTEFVLNDLQKHEITGDPHRNIPSAVKIENQKANLKELESYRKGCFEIQDFSSQCIGLACMPNPGDRWWDMCAGSGGKSLQLADIMNGKGVVTATDIREYILEELETRVRRSGFKNIRTAPWRDVLPESEFNRYDGVLVDAPCSSSGRWRRNPEARWTLAEERLGELNNIQKKLLLKAADAVKPGGILVYGTCSLFECENSELIKSFLMERPDFSLEPFPNPHTGGMTDGTLQTFPCDADCDASFVARMRKSEKQS